jgi:hypothetical protein
MKKLNGMTCVIALCLISSILSIARAASDSDVVGMIVDLQGHGEIVQQSVHSKMQLLQYIKPNMQLVVDADSKASVSHYPSKLIYQLNGPTTIEVGADGIKLIRGNAPTVKSMSEKQTLITASTNIVSGAIRMRGMPEPITVVAPKNGAVLLKTRAAFKWAAYEATTYQFTLEEKPARIIFSSKADSTGIELPNNVELAYGRSYRWSVSYTSAVDGRMHSANADFSILNRDEALKLLALKPEAGAPIEDWVLYASMLQNRQIFEEAREIWRDIARQRPDLDVVQNYAR